MENTIFSLVPPVVVILMVMITRRVILSLGVGIVTAALLLSNFSLGKTFFILWEAVKGIFISDHTWNTWSIFILLFLILLGVVTAFTNILGGSKAFGEWAMKRVKSRTGAQVMTAIVGIIIFIDDYFNSLIVGQISRPVTDSYRVSRAKLAYIIDSTSAPVCVVSPISSWGAYIIGILGTIFTLHHVTEYSPLTAFIKMIPMNLYVWAALAIVFIVAFWGIDFGPMKKHEARAVRTGEVVDKNKTISGDFMNPLPVCENGTVGDLIWPLASLVAATVLAMLWTGYEAIDGGKVSILTIFENTDVAKSLLYGGLGGLFVTLGIFVYKSFVKKSINPNTFIVGVKEGVKSMVPACIILIFAWTIVTLIDEFQTGDYLASLVQQSNIHISLFPFLLFIVAGMMAFVTGTSWGSFGILLPIAGEIAVSTDMNMLLPALSAVLAGTVFGDHCSPISDTTILSSTGAGSNHIDHVITQLPYAFAAACIAAIGYLMLGITESTLASLAAVIVGLFILAVIVKKQNFNES